MTKKRSGDPVDVYVGKQISIARKMSGLSQTDLGAALSVTFQQIQKYEKGSNRCAPGRLVVVAHKLGQPVTFFLPEDIRQIVAQPNLLTDMMTTHHGFNIARDFARVPEAKREPLARAFSTIVDAMLSVA